MRAFTRKKENAAHVIAATSAMQAKARKTSMSSILTVRGLAPFIVHSTPKSILRLGRTSTLAASAQYQSDSRGTRPFTTLASPREPSNDSLKRIFLEEPG